LNYCQAASGICLKRRCAASAIGCAAFATDGEQALLIVPKSNSGFRAGSPTPGMATHGVCANRSLGVGGLARAWSLDGPLWSARLARRLLEQQSKESAFGQPQQEQHRKPEQ
jgi:hypothetical protein